MFYHTLVFILLTLFLFFISVTSYYKQTRIIKKTKNSYSVYKDYFTKRLNYLKDHPNLAFFSSNFRLMRFSQIGREL